MEQEEADLVVRIFSASADNEPLIALPLHSRILCARSSFFAALLSERWQSTEHSTASDNLHNPNDMKPLPVDIIAASVAATYERCFALMHVRREDIISCRPFSGVEDALCMLRVASQLLFEDCMDACIEYMGMLSSWTPVEEVSIRGTLSSLQLPHINHSVLAKRLSPPQAAPLNQPSLVLRRMLVHLLQANCLELKDLDPSQPIPESCICLVWSTRANLVRAVEFRRFMVQSSLEALDKAISMLLLLFDRLLALRVADAAVRVFAGDTLLSQYITVFLNELDASRCNSDEIACRMCDLVACIVQVVLDDRVLVSQASRVALLKTWLPVCNTKFINARRRDIVTSMMNLMKALPMLERGEVYKHCMELEFDGPEELISSLRSWLDMLRDLHTQLSGGSSIVQLVSNDVC